MMWSGRVYLTQEEKLMCLISIYSDCIFKMKIVPEQTQWQAKVWTLENKTRHLGYMKTPVELFKNDMQDKEWFEIRVIFPDSLMWIPALCRISATSGISVTAWSCLVLEHYCLCYIGAPGRLSLDLQHTRHFLSWLRWIEQRSEALFIWGTTLTSPFTEVYLQQKTLDFFMTPVRSLPLFQPTEWRKINILSHH